MVSNLKVLLDLLVLLLGGEQLCLREGLSQRLLGHERLQLQQGRHSAVLADETGAIGVKVHYKEGGEKQAAYDCLCLSRGRRKQMMGAAAN